MKKYTVSKDWPNDQLVLTRTNKHGRQINFRFSIENIDDVHVDDDEVKSIRWGVDDFAHEAVDLEEYEQEKRGGEGFAERPILYDRAKFPEALQRMIHDHDYNNGISWNTIECYLNMMCLIKKEES